MTDDDRLLTDLAALDPTLIDPAPSPGSPRAHEILERAMNPSTSHTRTKVDSEVDAEVDTDVDTQADPVPGVPHDVSVRDHRSDEDASRRRRTREDRAGSRRGRRLAALAAAAAAVLVVVGIVVLAEPDRKPTPAAALTQAAERTGDQLTLRSDYRWVDEHGVAHVLRSEHRGDDVKRQFFKIDAAGKEHPVDAGDDPTVYIGNVGWIVDGDRVTKFDVPADQRNAPYAASSAAIVEAAVTESTVTEIGEDDVRGTPATHYRIRLDAAAIKRLDALPVNQRSGFELEYPSNVRSLDVWIADGYLRRIRVIQEWEGPDSPGTTVEFYDFGADITIEAPT